MKTITRTVLRFEELNDEQKAQALDHHRECNVLHEEWWTTVYDDAKTIGALLGFNIDRLNFDLDDGVCFTGTFSYPGTGIVKAVREHAPQDPELILIAQQAHASYAASFYSASGTITHGGRYSYEAGMQAELSVYYGTLGRSRDAEWRDLARIFAQWVHTCLQKEYEYLTSDEAVEQSIECCAEEFEIDEDGSIRF